MIRAALALGANIGDPHAALSFAVAQLRADPDLAVVAVSTFVRTAPVGGPPDQPDYLNAVVVVETAAFADPETFARELLHRAHDIERAQGRTREVRWGPRTMDVDVLAVGDLVLDDPELTVPHPRLAQRAFVLEPWAEVDAGFVVPGLGRVADLAAALREPGSPYSG